MRTLVARRTTSSLGSCSKLLSHRSCNISNRPFGCKRKVEKFRKSSLPPCRARSVTLSARLHSLYMSVPVTGGAFDLFRYVRRARTSVSPRPKCIETRHLCGRIGHTATAIADGAFVGHLHLTAATTVSAIPNWRTNRSPHLLPSIQWHRNGSRGAALVSICLSKRPRGTTFGILAFPLRTTGSILTIPLRALFGFDPLRFCPFRFPDACLLRTLSLLLLLLFGPYGISTLL